MCTGQQESLKEHADTLVETNNEMFSSISNGLLPTPAKSHYTFNLRDLSKVYQGILMFDAGKLNVRSFCVVSYAMLHGFNYAVHLPSRFILTYARFGI